MRHNPPRDAQFLRRLGEEPIGWPPLTRARTTVDVDDLSLGSCTILSAMKDPLVVVVAGPNGAGKSTTAPRLLRGALAVTEFVNADAIAQGLSAFRPESVASPPAE